jgi:SCP-2 sterol transfer family
MLREMLPYLTSVFIPPGWDEEYTRCYGFTMEEIFAWGMRSVEMKWKAIGYPFSEMPAGIYPFDPEMPHEERAARQIKLLKAGVLGPPNGAAKSSPEVQEIYFDVIARSAKADEIDEPITVQWKFSDAEPWHIVVENGSSRAQRGVTEDADVTLLTTWPEWIEISMRGEHPAKAVLRRKLRPRGSLRQIMRMREIWEPRRVTGDTGELAHAV